MAKWRIGLEETNVEEAVEDLMDDIDEELVLNGSSLQGELIESVNAQLTEVARDIQAGLERPEFEKAIEDAKQRIYQALRDAFAYKRR